MDLIYTRTLEPSSKRSSFKTASEFLEKPSYELHDVYRTLDVFGSECDLIQSEVYKNSHFLGNRNDKVLSVQTTTLKSNRKTTVKNTARVKNTDQIASFKWECLWMVTAFHWHFPFSLEMPMNRHH